MENGGAAGRSGVPSWDFWELGNWTSSHVASSSSYVAARPTHTTAAASSSTAAATCLPFSGHQIVAESSGDHRASQYHDHDHRHHTHLACLKLGKRQYYGEESGVAAMKRERPAAAPRCQVDGCSKVLVDEKEYHKRHKVCELHSKAPRVVVLGVEQRFCQQCSRSFHVISEFDDSKRSCRRRLAGHNERRRKNSSEPITRNPALESAIIGGMAPYLSASPGCALSLLSSKASPWIATSDFSSRSSAALNELIAENRAAVLARQLLADGSGWHVMVSVKQQQPPVFWSHIQHQAMPQPMPPHADGWSRLQGAGGHVTLDLMQMPDSFEIVSGRRSKSKEDDEESSEIWKSLAGTHVV
ncbi:unnamed protein product [Musa hybrid cultivar]